MNVSIGNSIRTTRVALGWSVQQLARASGVARQTIARLEAGAPWQSPTIDRLAAAMGTTAAAFLVPPASLAPREGAPDAALPAPGTPPPAEAAPVRDPTRRRGAAALAREVARLEVRLRREKAIEERAYARCVIAGAPLPPKPPGQGARHRAAWERARDRTADVHTRLEAARQDLAAAQASEIYA